MCSAFPPGLVQIGIVSLKRWAIIDRPFGTGEGQPIYSLSLSAEPKFRRCGTRWLGGNNALNAFYEFYAINEINAIYALHFFGGVLVVR